MKKTITVIQRFKPFIALVIINTLLFTGAYALTHHYEEVSYQTFIAQLNDKKIDEVALKDEGADVLTISYIDKSGKKYSTTGAKSSRLVENIAKNGIEIKGSIGMSAFQFFIIYAVVIGLLAYIFIMRLKIKANKEAQLALMNSKMMTMGLGQGMPVSNEKKNIGKEVKSTVRLNDVAGCDEEKKEVLEIVDFLKNAEKYKDIGATIPKGLLLVGNPGTGKTLLAKAIAGESGVKFLYVSGSEFVEKYVGVGAQRVRELFSNAQKNAPCIIFIDEIDAVGRQRGNGEGNQEQEQTLNQLLVEMDGMQENNGVIVIAATNRPDILDKAFMRKGRFDRKVVINLPDTKGREEILKVHAKKKKLEKDVDLADIAKKTYGFSGADLYAVMNEAALLAVRSNKQKITMIELEEAIDRVIMGHSSKTRKYNDMEKKLVAIHESGHVVLGLKMSEADKIDKVTIIPRGNAGGYAMLTPKEERFITTKKDMIEKICGLLGGKVAEELIYNEITTGPHNDLQRATNIARSMVTEYGMSKLGLTQFEQENYNNYAGYSNKKALYSDSIAEKIDNEVSDILKKCYDMTKKTLEENKELLLDLAKNLEDKELLTSSDIKEIESKH